MAAKYPEDTEEVLFEEFCKKCKLTPETEDILKENCLRDLDILSEISEGELTDLNIKIGQRKAILKALKRHRGEVSKVKNEDISSHCKNIRSSEEMIHRSNLPDTLASYADKVFQGKVPNGNITSFEEQCGNVEIHRCVLKEVWRNEEMKIRKCVTGNVPEDNLSKTIFIVGATGSGKTTLIDGVANYLFKVKWDDNYRVKLVDLTKEESENMKKGQCVSQTDWITVYTIPHAAETRTRYTLNIVDTPGFGDTRGIKRDEQLLKQVKYFFENSDEHGIDMVNAIGFVGQAPQARLSAAQRYIFDRVLSMFGKDVGDNIFVLATFADSNTPPLIETMKTAKVPFQAYFAFNNSALFSPTKEISNAEFMKMFWKLGMNSFESFFLQFNKSYAKSITLTAEVLQERDKLTNTLNHIQRTIQESCQKLNRLKTEKDTMIKHENDIKDNKNFEYNVDEERIVTVEVPSGQYTTNCSNCHMTCHEVCKIKDDKKKYKCVAIGEDGECEMCPNKCHWEDHFNQGYVYKMEIVKVKKTYDQMKNRYSQAKALVDGMAPFISMLEEDYKKVEKNIESAIQKAANCVRKLRKIALKPTSFSDVEYITLLIEEEKREMKKGWEERITILKDYKQRAEILHDKGIIHPSNE